MTVLGTILGLLAGMVVVLLWVVLVVCVYLVFPVATYIITGSTTAFLVVLCIEVLLVAIGKLSNNDSE